MTAGAIGALILGLGTAQAQQMTGPPLGQYIHSPSENGQNQLVTVYNPDHTLVIVSCWVSTAGTGSSGRPNGAMRREVAGDRNCNRGTWTLEGNTFCFTLDRGADAGKRQCKTGRLIGKVALDGTPIRE